MDATLSPDQRADMVLNRMTLDEKIQLVHGTDWGVMNIVDPRPNGGAGFVPGIPRLHIPDINMTDSAVGICKVAIQGRYATLLPSTFGAAASWEPDAPFLYGSVIGREARARRNHGRPVNARSQIPTCHERHQGTHARIRSSRFLGRHRNCPAISCDVLLQSR